MSKNVWRFIQHELQLLITSRTLHLNKRCVGCKLDEEREKHLDPLKTFNIKRSVINYPNIYLTLTRLDIRRIFLSELNTLPIFDHVSFKRKVSPIIF